MSKLHGRAVAPKHGTLRLFCRQERTPGFSGRLAVNQTKAAAFNLKSSTFPGRSKAYAFQSGPAETPLNCLEERMLMSSFTTTRLNANLMTDESPRN